MKQLGGELPVKPNENQCFFTDSGRSSLRLFLRNFPDKKVLLPDFLCEVIVDVLVQEKVEFEFYHIDNQLNIDKDSVNGKSYDVLYVINYFGKIHNSLKEINTDRCILLEDNVFGFDVKNTYNSKQWYSFNSFRKISNMPEGSMVKTNMGITNLIEPTIAPFVAFKYSAKEEKFMFLNKKTGEEDVYLEKFKYAEEMLDQQKCIFSMSDRTYVMLLDHYKTHQDEDTRRRKNYNILMESLRCYELTFSRMEYSYFVMRVPNRDKLKSFLFNHKLFLPIHWPFFGVDNDMYRDIISIPLFSFYSGDTMLYVVEKINDFLVKQG